MIWVHFDVWEGNRRCGCGIFGVAWDERGLLSKGVLYRS